MGREAKKAFNSRAFVSVSSGLIFVLTALSGLAMFFAPSCRVARETGWSFLGHDKDHWVGVHIWFGVALLVACAFHVYFNWRPLVGYFKNRLVPSFTFKAEWIVALILCAVIYGGIACEVAPFSSLTDWEESFKQHQFGQGQRGRQLGQAGMREPQGPGASSAEEQGLYVHSSEHSVQQQAGRRAGRGIGRKTLREFCYDEGIDLSWAIRRLSREGFAAKETMTMREIADEFAVHPSELRTILQGGQ